MRYFVYFMYFRVFCFVVSFSEKTFIKKKKEKRENENLRLGYTAL